MVSYTQFRDLTAVFAAGNGLTTAGATYGEKVRQRVSSLREGEEAVLHKADDYGQDFWKTYAAPNPDVTDGPKERHLALTAGAITIADAIEKIGPDVVSACSMLVGADAEHGSALLRASTSTA